MYNIGIEKRVPVARLPRVGGISGGSSSPYRFGRSSPEWQLPRQFRLHTPGDFGRRRVSTNSSVVRSSTGSPTMQSTDPNCPVPVKPSDGQTPRPEGWGVARDGGPVPRRCWHRFACPTEFVEAMPYTSSSRGEWRIRRPGGGRAIGPPFVWFETAKPPRRRSPRNREPSPS
jgi:hypothetical protein